jgi:hypothetical protein
VSRGRSWCVLQHQLAFYKQQQKHFVLYTTLAAQWPATDQLSVTRKSVRVRATALGTLRTFSTLAVIRPAD